MTEKHTDQEDVTFFRELVENLPMVTYVDLPGSPSLTSYVSPQIEGMLGYPTQEWLDDPDLLFKVIHPDDLDRMCLERRTRPEEGDSSHLFRVVARDGRVFTIQSERSGSPRARLPPVACTLHPRRQQAPRHRKDRYSGQDPAQAGAADPGGTGDHAAAHRRGLRVACRLRGRDARSRRLDRAVPSRALGRHRLPTRAPRRRDSPRGADRGDRRRLRCSPAPACVS
ncbi:MAG: PAS domain-containing protein [Actinobacteria bacterium]|nr:MAG: PAS domain-containing protein [Actinomycetota bacterium]